ncbi:hypothetical protein F0562_026106 [Nyssa sinensis]|uniref:Uncharacterized protein n=1 Tax=Nyssa sinensis TaxID=561372 RepID=A0A5J5B9U4_9ASTE|nr:hypothetical protein F0562_026106 [Nyssa sinensis]
MLPISARFTPTHRRFLSKPLSPLLHRLLSTQSSSIEYTLSHPIYTVWGANTGVGKTLVSAGLAASILSPPLSSTPTKFIYIKPVQTGFPADSDSHFFYRKFSENFLHRRPQSTVFASNHVLNASIPAAKAVLGCGVEKRGKCDCGFRDLGWPFRLPTILVGDGWLSGISGTISAYESLKLRGYDVVVVLEDHNLVNEVPLFSYLQNRVHMLVLPPVPQDMSNSLVEWFDESQNVFNSLKEIMLSAFLERIQKLHDMPKKAGNIFWWPFTQHKLVPEETITVIDSRCGEYFGVYRVRDHDSITQQFDACASWWTQGTDATLHIELAKDMGYVAARFGHVMFPENVYEPTLECAELLLEGVGKGWASRAFFSDNILG